MLFYLFKAFDKIEKKEQIGFFSSSKRPIFPHACTTCSELPFNVTTMISSSNWETLFNSFD